MRRSKPLLPFLVVLIASTALAQVPGTIETIAGSGVQGFAGDGGPALQAAFNTPTDLVIAPDGTYYICDFQNHRIRAIAPDGTVSTFAGNGAPGFAGDGGPAIAASLNGPTGIALDLVGNLYIADGSNRRIRRVDTNGVITTYAGTGAQGFSGDGGPASAAMLDAPTRIDFDANDVLHFTDQNNHRIRRIDASGTISTIAGNGPTGAAARAFGGDGGPAASAQFQHPTALKFDAGGNLVVTDQLNLRIRRIDRSGTIQTIAGTGVQGFSGDGGPATAATIGFPGQAAIDSAGNVYFADTPNHRVRRIDPAGTITTVAGTGAAASTGDGGPASGAAINEPFGIELDARGNLYILEAGSHRIRRVNAIAPPAPAFVSRGVTNGASFASGGIAVGSIVTIFGANLSTADGLVVAPSVPLPTELAGTTVTVDGVPAALFAVFRQGAAEQINLQWPFVRAAPNPLKAQSTGISEVVITANGFANAPVAVPTAPAQPGVFIVADFTSATIRQDGSLVTEQDPAQRGAVLTVFCTGLGAVDDPPAPGAPAGADPLSPTRQIPQVSIGGAPAELFYSGLAPGFVGLYQLNIRVPQLAPSGVVQLVVTQSGIAGQPAPLAIQ